MTPFTPILADISATEIILVACGIISAGAAVAGGVYGMTRKSQERIVTISPDGATKGELEAHKLECKTDRASLWRKIDADRDSQIRSASDRSAGIYNKIDEVRKELTVMHEQARKDLTDMHAETRKEMGQGFSDLERAIGKLEGKLEGK